METISLPPSIEQIAKRAEEGVAEVARGAVAWAFGLVSDLVDEVKPRRIKQFHNFKFQNGKSVSNYNATKGD